MRLSSGALWYKRDLKSERRIDFIPPSPGTVLSGPSIQFRKLLPIGQGTLFNSINLSKKDCFYVRHFFSSKESGKGNRAMWTNKGHVYYLGQSGRPNVI